MKKKIMFYWLVLCALLATAALTQLAPQTAVSAQDKKPLTDQEFNALFESQQLPPEQLAPMAATPCVGGMAGAYPCDKVDLMAFMPLANIGGGNGNDIWGWTDPVSHKEYALMGRTTGTAFVDITDPVNPIYLGNLPTHTSSSTWRDIKTYNNYAFIVSEASGHGMQVFDLTRLRNVPAPPATFTEDAHYNQFGNAHNLVINEDTGFAYAVGTGTCSGGLHMVNIQNPLAPTNAGCFSTDGYTHDAQCVAYTGPDADHQGQEICFNSNEDTLTIVNVTNKAAPVQLSRTTYSGSAYTHQGWLTEDQVYFLMDDELDEQNFGHNTRTRIWNVSNLDAPQLIGFFDAPVAAIDHNLYTKGNYTFQANYRAGLRILKNTNIASGTLTQEAFFDIYPSSNSASFNGAWSVYPYFESGIVVVSGIEQGLFILKPTSLASDFSLAASPTSQSVCVPSNTSFNLTIGSSQGFNDPVTLSAVGIPAGYSGSFTTNPVTPPGTSTLNVNNTGAAVAGSYNIDVVGIAPTSTHTVTVGLNLFTAPPVGTTLTAPANGATGVLVLPTLSWTAVANTSGYALQVATDSGFNTIVYSATPATNSQTLPAGSVLNYNTTYYWRVTPQNLCGSGPVSTVFSFTTQDVPATICRTPNLVISDNSTATDSMTVPTAETIQDLNLSINATHTWVGDLSFSLKHVDTGTTVVVIDRPGTTGTGAGCSANDVDVELDDEGVDGPVEGQCSTTPPALFGSPTPNNALSAFDGQSFAGTWQLSVTDSAGGDTGVVNEWCLIPTLMSSNTYGVDLSADQSLTAVAGETVTYTVALTNTGNTTDTFAITVSGATWTTNPTSANLTVPAGETSTFEIWVDVPGGATNGDSDTATVTAVSLGSSAATDTSDLTTTVVMPVYGVDLSNDMAANAAPGSTVTYTVWITNSGDTADTFDLSATAVWPTALSTYSLSLNAGETTSFWVWVHAPANTTAGDNDVAAVTAVSQNDSNATDSANLTTTVVQPTYGVDLSGDMATTGWAGTTVTYTLWVTNSGNVADMIDVTASSAWTLTLSANSLSLDAGETGSVWAWVDVPANAATGDNDTAVITATSQTDSAATDNASLTTTAIGIEPALVLSADQAQSDVVGATVTYTLWLTNSGNVPDTYNLAVASDWTAVVSPTMVDLTAGETTAVWVWVTIPATATVGHVDNAVVTAVSQNYALSDTAQLDTTALSADNYSVQLSAPVTQTTTANSTFTTTVWITNTGSQTDTYDVVVTGTWVIANTPVTVTLAPGQNAAVWVTITTPNIITATTGTMNGTMVKAISQGDTAVSDTTYLTTLIQNLTIFLPVGIKN